MVLSLPDYQEIDYCRSPPLVAQDVIKIEPALPSDGKITNLTLNFRPEAFLFIALPTPTQTH
jgi:hypothetical protein